MYSKGAIRSSHLWRSTGSFHSAEESNFNESIPEFRHLSGRKHSAHLFLDLQLAEQPADGRVTPDTGLQATK